MVLSPMAARGQEAVGSMGNDAALAVLSTRPVLLFAYFKQLFAQVTNPPIDPLREELVMSLMSFIGRQKNLLDETPEHVRHADRWVAALRAEGGTEMLPALRLALDGQERAGRLRQVIFLTDGAVGNEAQLFAAIRERLGASRLFTVGIGSAPNAHFMREAARLGRGTFTFIGSTAEVQERMGALFRKLEAPALTDVTLELPAEAGAEVLLYKVTGGGHTWPNGTPYLPRLVGRTSRDVDFEVLVTAFFRRHPL